MENEKRLIDANALVKKFKTYKELFLEGWGGFSSLPPKDKARVDELDNCIAQVINAPTVDAYTAEQVKNIIRQVDKDERELRKRVAWLKSCINCKIRKECHRHGAKVVHDCDHWEYGDPVKSGQWIGEGDGYADGGLVYDIWHCSECNYCIDDGTDDPELLPRFCPNCGEKMDGGVSDG